MRRLGGLSVCVVVCAVLVSVPSCGSDEVATGGGDDGGSGVDTGQNLFTDGSPDGTDGASEGGRACTPPCDGGTRCVDGKCVCPIYTKLCGGKCIPTSVDPDNCGACGTNCGPTEVCSAGKCLPEAGGCIPAPQGGGATGLEPCNRECVDKLNDNRHCGTCGNACPPGQGCVNGTCVGVIAVGTPPPCPAGGPPVQTGPGGCAGTIASTTFRWALCSCGTVTLSTSLITDGYDSSLGPYPPSPKQLGGGVGANGTFTGPTSNELEIGGALFCSDAIGITTNSPAQVKQDLNTNGSLTAGNDTLGIAGDATVKGNVSTTSSIAIAKTLFVSASSTIGPNVTRASTVTKAINVAPPCDCDVGKKVPIQAIVTAAATANDNAKIGLAAGVLATPLATASRLDLPCGKYYLTGINQPGRNVTIYAHGRTAVFIDGNVVGQVVSFTLEPLAELDVFVTGTVTAGGELILGSPNFPALSRTYIGGASTLLLSGEAGRLAGNIYAADAPVDVTSHLALYGGLYAKTFTNSETAEIHFDRGVLSAGNDCNSPPPPAGCGSCKDCNNQACIAGKCDKCADSSQCCAPLVCVDGTCVSRVN